MAKKKSRRPGGGGRSVRYTAEGVRAAEQGFASDPERGRYALSKDTEYNDTLQGDLNEKVAQATDETRQKELADVLARVAIEYNKTPDATIEARDVYAEALASVEPELRAQVLAMADAIVRDSQIIPASGQIPSQLFGDAGGQSQAAPEAAQPEQGPLTLQDTIRESLKSIPSPEEAMKQMASVTQTIPASGVIEKTIPTAQGMADAVGEPFSDPERANAIFGKVLAKMGELAARNGKEPGVFSQAVRDPQFQGYRVDPSATAPVVSNDPAGELALRPYTDPFTDELFYAPHGLFQNLAEYPMTVQMPRDESTRIGSYDRVALRRAQSVHDAYRQAFFDHVNQGLDPEAFYDTPLAKALTDEYKRMTLRLDDMNTPDPSGNIRGQILSDALLGTASLGERSRGSTALESGSNPVATYNPLVAAMQGDTRAEQAEAFSDRYGRPVRKGDQPLMTTLFSPSQYGLRMDDRPRGAVNRLPGMRGLGLSRYETGLVAANTLMDAINNAAKNRGLNLQFALTGRPPTTDLTGADRMGLDMRTALDNYFRGTTYNNLLLNADKPQVQFALDARARGLLESILQGSDPAGLPTGIIPVPTPEEFVFKTRLGDSAPARPYFADYAANKASDMQDKDAKASLSQADRVFDKLHRLYGENSDFAAGKKVAPYNPYFLMPALARNYGVYFDPFTEQMGGAYVAGTPPTLPPDLAAELFANLMEMQPGAFRGNVVEGIAGGLEAFGPQTSALAMEAQMSGVRMPRRGLLSALRNIPESVVPNAAETVRGAVEASRAGAPPVPAVRPSSTGYDGSGMKPAVLPENDDFSYLPSLYNTQNMAASQNRMAVPLRRGVLAQLITA